MKVLFTILFTSISLLAFSGTRYTLAQTTGGVTITQTIETHVLSGGDTLDLNSAGVYDYVQTQGLNGSAGNFIVVRGSGARQTSPLVSFQQPVWYNVSYVKFIGLRDTSWYGLHKMSNTIHDVTFSHCQFVNAVGSYSTQPHTQWDDASASPDMVFAGSKSKTFYNIKYLDCRFDGFKNVTPLTVGSNWGSGEEKRSIALDWEFVRDTFQNITAESPGYTVAGISATGFNWLIHDCRFYNILGPGSYQHSHSQSILFYGSADIYGNYQDGSYASLVRGVPLSFSGLAGYQANAFAQIRCFRNITHNSLSYSAFEMGQNNKANRNTTNYCYVARATVVYNTVYRTVQASYNGPYHGAICDDVNQDTLDVAYNIIFLPEYDNPPIDSTAHEYVVPIISASPTNLTKNGNKIFYTFSTSVIQDTVEYIPSSGSSLLNAGLALGFSDLDFYGHAPSGNPDLGAVERVAAPTGTKQIKIRNHRRINK